MKRKVAKRKLKRTCDQCGKRFFKGHVYYVQRVVFALDNIISAYEYTCCAKCNYEDQRRKERYERFKESGVCKHPVIDEVWSYMPGEAVMEPDHDECLVCGEWL